MGKKIRKYIFFAAFEPIEYSFKNEQGSSLYIEKFKLSEKEIQIIGGWYQPIFADFFVFNLNTEGLGIGISFLPNRKLVVFQNGNNRQGQNYYLIGNWKIIENKLFCNIEYRIGNMEYEKTAPTQGRMRIKSAEIEKLAFRNDFVEIFTLETYTIAYVNRKPFNFSDFDEDIKNYLLIHNKDQIRYRSIQDEWGGYWIYMDEIYELGYFLLNNSIETKEDVIKLINLIIDYRNKRE